MIPYRLKGGIHSPYDLFMAPLEHFILSSLRSTLIGKAAGSVLEIGAGTGVNLSYYRWEAIQKLILTDLKGNDPSFRKIVQRRLKELKKRVRERNAVPGGSPVIPPLEWDALDVEHISFASGTFDTVVVSLLFCSVKNPLKGMSEVYRVLRPSGKLIFIEHVRPNDPCTATLFDRITPAWRRIASGCHLNRDTLSTIEKAGFTFVELYRPDGGVFVGGVGVK